MRAEGSSEGDALECGVGEGMAEGIERLPGVDHELERLLVRRVEERNRHRVGGGVPEEPHVEPVACAGVQFLGLVVKSLVVIWISS